MNGLTFFFLSGQTLTWSRSLFVMVMGFKHRGCDEGDLKYWLSVYGLSLSCNHVCCSKNFCPSCQVEDKNVEKRWGTFSFYAPSCWNSLPEDLRAAESFDIFKFKLKTYLFSLGFDKDILVPLFILYIHLWTVFMFLKVSFPPKYFFK